MKTCRTCQKYPIANFEHKKCHTCYWDGVAVERLERNLSKAEGLRKEADAAFEAIEQHFLDFEKGGDQ